MKAAETAIGVIGGSGLYELEGLSDVKWQKVQTPFGAPSQYSRFSTTPLPQVQSGSLTPRVSWQVKPPTWGSYQSAQMPSAPQ